jgi:hypothetical protein
MDPDLVRQQEAEEAAHKRLLNGVHPPPHLFLVESAPAALAPESVAPVYASAFREETAGEAPRTRKTTTTSAVHAGLFSALAALAGLAVAPFTGWALASAAALALGLFWIAPPLMRIERAGLAVSTGVAAFITATAAGIQIAAPFGPGWSGLAGAALTGWAVSAAIAYTAVRLTPQS